MSASSTTSALCKLLVIKSLANSSGEGISNCTGFCTELIARDAFLPPQLRQSRKQLLDRSLAWVYIAHGGLNVIVSGDMLQRKRVRVLSSLGQKSMMQGVQAGIGMRLDLFPYLAHLLFEHPCPRALVGSWGLVKT